MDPRRARPSLADLLAALDDPARALRAARALGRRRDPAAIRALVAHYDAAAFTWRTWSRQHWNPRTQTLDPSFPEKRALRYAIVDALGRIGAPAVPSAFAAFEHGDFLQVARRAGPAALDGLLPFLRSPHRLVVAGALRALRDLGDPRAIPHILPLWSHRAWSIEYHAYRALRTLGRRDPDALAAAVEAHGIAAPWSIYMRARAGDRRIIPEVIRMWRAGEGPSRLGALRTLGMFRVAEALPWMLEALADPRDDLAEAAVDALGDFGDPVAVGPLIGALSRHWSVSDAARGALRRLLRGSPRPLLEAARSGSASAQVAEVLRSIKSIEDIEALTEALDHASPEIRAAAARVSWQLVGRDRRLALGPILERLLLADPEAQVRREAASALGALHVYAAQPSLRKALDDLDEGVRRQAEETLAWMARYRGGAALGPGTVR
ncbi:MAG: HEAT repeat domain-containing protein [Minicystis sp.]